MQGQKIHRSDKNLSIMYDRVYSKSFAGGKKLLKEEEICEVMERFRERNPNPKCELEWKNVYTLLVSTVLSAQATDKSVNEHTRELFKIAATPQKMLALGRQKLVDFIRPIGLFERKSTLIIALSQKLIDDFGGNVPQTMEELLTLPGVGRKTANVILNVAWQKPTMPVDTHLMRICPKIGLATGKTPSQIEKSLLERIPPQFLKNAHHWLLLHGRYICKAKNAKCNECFLLDICEFVKNKTT